jgi:4a-hydroxytetrahydrobiopterin dehydratase
MGWHKNDFGAIARAFFFSNYKDELIFANLVGELADKANHHPTILIEWGKCTITTWTHDTKSLTDKDVVMAKQYNELFDSKFSQQTHLV